MANVKLWSGNIYVWFDLIWYSWLAKQTCQLSLTHSIRATENHAQSWKSHANFIKNPLKIAKFIKKHLKVYMQEYNCLKTAMAISKVPQCPSFVETPNKIF